MGCTTTQHWKSLDESPHYKSLLESLQTCLFFCHLHQPVYYCAEESNSFPQTKEWLQHWWGPNENTGYIFCSNVLTLNDTVIPHSVLCPAFDQPLNVNKRHVDWEGFLTLKDSTGTMFQAHDDDGARDETVRDIEPESLIGYKFIRKIDENGYRARIIWHFPDQKKYMISLGAGNMESIISYNEMIDAAKKRMETETKRMTMNPCG